MLHDSLHCLSGFEIVPKYIFGSEGERTSVWYEGNAELGQGRLMKQLYSSIGRERLKIQEAIDGD